MNETTYCTCRNFQGCEQLIHKNHVAGWVINVWFCLSVCMVFECMWGYVSCWHADCMTIRYVYLCIRLLCKCICAYCSCGKALGLFFEIIKKEYCTYLTPCFIMRTHILSVINLTTVCLCTCTCQAILLLPPVQFLIRISLHI